MTLTSSKFEEKKSELPVLCRILAVVFIYRRFVVVISHRLGCAVGLNCTTILLLRSLVISYHRTLLCCVGMLEDRSRAHGWQPGIMQYSCIFFRYVFDPKCSEFEISTNLTTLQQSRGLGVWRTATSSYKRISQYTVPRTNVDTLLRLFPGLLVLVVSYHLESEVVVFCPNRGRGYTQIQKMNTSEI